MFKEENKSHNHIGTARVDFYTDTNRCGNDVGNIDCKSDIISSMNFNRRFIN